MGYYFYYPLKNKIFYSQNTKFFENSFMVQEASQSHRLLKMNESDKGLEIIQKEDIQPSENTSEEHNEVAPINVEPQSVGVPIYRSARYVKYQIDMDTLLILRTMNMEMQSMKDNQVWYLVDLPSNGRIVRCKWLFKKKTDMDGNVHTFKARLVAKGFTQTYGVNYGETFSPVADIRAIRILLAIAAFYDCDIWKMDVKTSWNKRFDEEIKKISFSQNPDEPCVYLKASGSNVAFLVLYVDDILLMGNSVTMLQEKILKKFRMESSKKEYTPMMEKPDYRKSQGAKTPNEKSAKQSTTAMSSTEAEYIVAAEASMEAVLMRKFIDGLGDVMPSNNRLIKMLCDNEPALAIASDPGILKGARHFQRKYHYIREVIQEREIVLKKVHTNDNVAGPFTKPMPLNKHFEHAMAIGIVPASSLM
ncbi:zinc finger, CCHC-type containing protein [Tanacetum coccineum]|uniref:Zinc finger, CCHC-type containing protein n=1 Tax=Tanacetum coccineum TaxID=301880 RepID=A0ABQ5FIH3_9ASTR